ncbi:MAG: 50S ribosomal protein L24 [Candidatus Pacebacteria bacterium]|nr:50S ribosomal protein L24 [Candidatus Paceibacterota bacterium]MBP9852154.1 50S ribosomal protein L24 [Candidatus Paceibacterota bacterium]
MKFKKGDKVIVVAGRDKGKSGSIVTVLREKNRVVIDGINMMKKQQKAKRSGEKGSIIDMSMPINASNVMIVDSKSGKPSRIGKKKVGDKFIRVSKKSDQEI